MLRIAAKSVSDPNNLPAVLASSGVSCKLAALKQARALIRLKLRSSAHSQGLGEQIRDRIRAGHIRKCYYFNSCLRTYYGG